MKQGEEEMENEIKAPKKLYRSKTDRYIGGICGGLGSYLNLDSNLVRILFIISIFLGGAGFILYIAGLIIIPENPAEEEAGSRRTNPNFIWGIVLVVIGCLLLFRQLGWYYNFHFWHIPWIFIWAGLLIAGGLYLIFGYHGRSADASEKAPADTSPGASEPSHRLFRSRQERMFAGVCGGIAREFGIDPSLVRLAWVILTLLSIGAGIILYIVAIFVMPEEPLQNSV